MKKNQLNESCFYYKRHGYGFYEVTYTTPHRGDYWTALLETYYTDPVIHDYYPSLRALRTLRHAVITRGIHYTHDGRAII